MQNHQMALKKGKQYYLLKRSLFFYIPTDEDKVANGETRLYSKNYQRDNGWKVLEY